jgi:hypothetical protein
MAREPTKGGRHGNHGRQHRMPFLHRCPSARQDGGSNSHARQNRSVWMEFSVGTHNGRSDICGLEVVFWRSLRCTDEVNTMGISHVCLLQGGLVRAGRVREHLLSPFYCATIILMRSGCACQGARWLRKTSCQNTFGSWAGKAARPQQRS